MQLSLQNFSSLVGSMAASVQGASATVLDMTVGSVLRALLEASASVALWLQYMLLQVLAMTRLSSSVGTDADSWVNDFGMLRLGAVPATGIVTMSSFNPASQAAVITDGMTVRLSDGSQTFVVVGGPYIRSIGQPSVDVSVQALSSGLAGNVQAGAVNMLGTAIPGIDTVSNSAVFSGGAAAETDDALRTRFVNYINTRAQATEKAIMYAATSISPNISVAIQENQTPNGTFLPGNVHVIADDGTGTPSAAELAKVASAIDQVRPVGTTITVAGPSVVQAIVTATIVFSADADQQSIIASASVQVGTYIDALAVGQPLPYSRIIALLYAVSPFIANVTGVTLNGGVADLGGVPGSVVRCESVALAAGLS